jgi:putative cell wall-binding protein
MNKKGTKALASATLMSLVLTTALATGNVKAAANGQATRVGGTDRYETAAKVATTNFTTSDNVVLVSGEGYADSVSASVLAKKLNAPIVLTGSQTLDANAKSAIETLKAKNVYIIGGTGSISASIESGLKSNYTVTRLGGKDRYATNLAIANKLVDLGVSKDNIIAVAGTGFADALSVAPVAAADNEILLLTKNDTDAMKATADFAKDSNVTVVGTTNVVNGDIYNQLKADKRIDGGADRFATNINVLKAFDSDLKADKLYVANATQANPDNLYADALVASAIAGKYSAPLVLVDKDGSTGTNNAVSYIGTKATKDTDLQVVGGTGVISDATVQSIEDAVKDKDNDPEVSSITATSLNQIKVVFNQEVDSDTAEDVTNYEVDGSQLTDADDVSNAGKTTNAKASLQDDNKTVLITLNDKQDQNKSIDVKVRKGVLTADKAKTVPEFTQNVTFSDTTAPTVDSVSARGNKKIVVKFSEPINVGKYKNASDVYSKFKINDKSIGSFGIDTTLTEAKDSVEDGNNNFWTDEIDFYFTTTLTTGDNVLKISDGSTGQLEDAAGFPVSETSQDFTIDTLTTSPKVTSITANDDGKVYVNFDRPMDKKTATDPTNYKINNIELVKGTNCSNIKLENGDTQVKIIGLTGSAKLVKNANTIAIDDNVKDAYGNYVPDDTNQSFNLEEDTTKPTVTSVYALNENTIRVAFSKSVDASYATNKSNYKLKDSDGNDISSQLGIITVPGDSSPTTADVVDIPVSGDLGDSTYTITIKNIQDMASTPNVMNDYVNTFSGSSDVNSGVKVYNVSPTKVAMVFTKAMDTSTLNDISNYKYLDNETPTAKTKSLPSKTQISVGTDGKTVTFDFSNTSLKVGSGASDVNTVTGMYASNVKDSDGNSLDIGSNGGTFASATSTSSIKDKSLNVYYDGKDLKADVSFENPIDVDTVNSSEAKYFQLNNTPADSINVNGNKLTLTFNRAANDETFDGTKINSVKKLGNNAVLDVVQTVKDVDGNITTQGTSVKDITGATLGTTTSTGADVKPYFYNAAPKTIYDSDWTATKTFDASGNITAATVKLKFDTPVDNVKASDFKFAIGGTTIDADDVTTKSGTNNTVTFTFNKDNDHISSVAAASSITVTPKDTLGDSLKDISTVKDGNGDYAYYAPSDNDLKGRTVSINSVDTVLNVKSTVGQITGANAITVPDNTKISDFKANANVITADNTFDIYKPDGTTVEDSTNVVNGDKLIVKDDSGTTVATYTITVK